MNQSSQITTEPTPSVEQVRLKRSRSTAAQRKSQFGQYFTPATSARFMANLFVSGVHDDCHLLDPGAGIGSLTSAFLERCTSTDLAFAAVDVSAFERDSVLHDDLEQTLARHRKNRSFAYTVLGGDFIEAAVNQLQFGDGRKFTHAILNPPYKKISSDSYHRRLLRQAGIEAVNLYSAFVALSLLLLKPGGQLVAIIPRSFCNGPYYRPFRNLLLEHSAIRRLHLFDSRNKAFKDDGVLQENVIIALERDGHQSEVTISTSTDDSFDDLAMHVQPFDRIVLPANSERFIHIPTSAADAAATPYAGFKHTLDDIGVQVSTGPVVDFRLKEFLRKVPVTGTAPLLYPGHFSGQDVQWPRLESKKANAIERNADTEKWLYPSGFYCVVRRLSSKEEKHRIVAGLVCPDRFAGAEMLGFENHLNVFHANKKGLPEMLARGLATFLGATAVDETFRRFNGHTQVNATDLKQIKYPSRQSLVALGKWATRQVEPTQAMIDKQVEQLDA